LFDGPIEAGTHQVDWDATNESGEAIDPGIYLFHLQASEYEKWHPMIMVL
jgi:flagellar hook assembly protein FlgD